MKIELCGGDRAGVLLDLAVPLSVGDAVPGLGADHYRVSSILGAIDGIEYARAYPDAMNAPTVGRALLATA